MIKRVEIQYRGIFQKNLARKLGGDVVLQAVEFLLGRHCPPCFVTQERSYLAEFLVNFQPLGSGFIALDQHDDTRTGRYVRIKPSKR